MTDSAFKSGPRGLYVEKDPSALLDYKLDWAAWLPEGDAIASVLWNVSPGITKVEESNTASTATVWISGGVAGQTYSVACRITTNDGRVDERSFRVQVREL